MKKTNKYVTVLRKKLSKTVSLVLLHTVFFATPGLKPQDTYACENHPSVHNGTQVPLPEKGACQENTLCEINVEKKEERLVLPDTTRLLLIRHGKTDWNTQQRIQSHSDIPLNEVGKQQAEHVAQVLFGKHEKIHALYASDLQRAVSTAAPIARAFDVSIVTNPLLRERHMGDAEGMTETQFNSIYGPALAALEISFPDPWQRRHHTPVAGAEAEAAVFTRVDTFLKDLAKKHRGQTVVIVTHGAVIKTLMAYYTGATQRTSNCCIAEMHYNFKDHTLACIKVENLN